MEVNLNKIFMKRSRQSSSTLLDSLDWMLFCWLLTYPRTWVRYHDTIHFETSRREGGSKPTNLMVSEHRFKPTGVNEDSRARLLCPPGVFSHIHVMFANATRGTTTWSRWDLRENGENLFHISWHYGVAMIFGYSMTLTITKSLRSDQLLLLCRCRFFFIWDISLSFFERKTIPISYFCFVIN